MTNLSAMGKRSRRRGKTGERELCKELEKLELPGFQRSQQHTGRHGDADIENTLTETSLLWECKRVERINVNAVMQRAIEDASAKGRLPIIAHRKNRHPWLVTFQLNDLWDVVDELFRLRQPPEMVLEELLAELSRDAEET